MKLNEAKFIVEIKRLASNIAKSEDLDQCHSIADVITSICSILDADNQYEEFQPQFEEEDFKEKVENLNIDAFNEAKREQQGAI